MTNQELFAKLVFSGDKEDIELYNNTAEAMAKALTAHSKMNKPSQMRRFFDELTLWHQRSRECTDEQFAELLPRIKMLKAKAAYAQGREHVDETFFRMVKAMIDPLSNKTELERAKLFFEAVLGFSKMHNPKN
jgi:CRISPR-associated protein Csm2